MKKIAFITLLFISFSAFGQNYLFFNPSSKNLFATAPVTTKTYSLSFDSVLVTGSDTSYYNFFTVPDTIINAPSNCPFWGSGCIFYQNHPSWIGKQIDYTASGMYRFYNLANDTLTFDMNINI